MFCAYDIIVNNMHDEFRSLREWTSDVVWGRVPLSGQSAAEKDDGAIGSDSSDAEGDAAEAEAESDAAVEASVGGDYSLAAPPAPAPPADKKHEAAIDGDIDMMASGPTQNPTSASTSTAKTKVSSKDAGVQIDAVSSKDVGVQVDHLLLDASGSESGSNNIDADSDVVMQDPT